LPIYSEEKTYIQQLISQQPQLMLPCDPDQEQQEICWGIKLDCAGKLFPEFAMSFTVVFV
jgi:hypothetical protein